MTNARMVAAEQQRRVIPLWAQVLFEDTTDEGLVGVTQDPRLSSELRMFARLEVEYRRATGVVVTHDLVLGGLKRRSFATEAEAQVILAEDDAEAEAIAASAAAFRERVATAGERIRADWAAWSSGEEHLVEGPVAK